jgi:hypothetical protein
MTPMQRKKHSNLKTYLIVIEKKITESKIGRNGPDNSFTSFKIKREYSLGSRMKNQELMLCCIKVDSEY